MDWFSASLRLKSLWMVLNGNGLWSLVITAKYLKKQSVVLWLRDKHFGIRGVLVFWRGFLQTLPWLGIFLAWKVGNGEHVQIRIDPIIKIPNTFSWPVGFLEFLEDLDIVTHSQARNILSRSQYW